MAVAQCNKLPGDCGKVAREALEIQLAEVKKSWADTKPRPKQHTNVGHKLARTELKRAKLDQEMCDETERMRVAQERVAQERVDNLRAQAVACDAGIVELRKELVAALPETAPAPACLRIDEAFLEQHRPRVAVKPFTETDVFKTFAEVLGESAKGKQARMPVVAPPPFSGLCAAASDSDGLPAPRTPQPRSAEDTRAGEPDDMDLDELDGTVTEDIIEAVKGGADKASFSSRFGSGLRWVKAKTE
ncbi:unnamed protein product [Prorocentrum cordatum]|uniref:Uncharacterized protein n=1 Tax=Prorocentrum cordatum TaxID=2364126 RepID=A0ABN9SWR4_9DINO|nr:unnamed protein product [Polarella glacialis]